MTPIEHLRVHVLDMTQGQFATFAGVSQGTVSKWEKGEGLRVKSLTKLRAALRRRRIHWDDAWFFQLPPTAKLAS